MSGWCWAVRECKVCQSCYSVLRRGKGFLCLFYISVLAVEFDSVLLNCWCYLKASTEQLKEGRGSRLTPNLKCRSCWWLQIHLCFALCILRVNYKFPFKAAILTPLLRSKSYHIEMAHLGNPCISRKKEKIFASVSAIFSCLSAQRSKKLFVGFVYSPLKSVGNSCYFGRL